MEPQGDMARLFLESHVASILNRERYHGLPDEQRRELSAAETIAHSAAHEIHKLIQVYLSDGIKDRALDVTAVGLFAALGRLIAEQHSGEQGRAIIDSGHAIMRAELEHWAQIAGGEHVHH